MSNQKLFYILAVLAAMPFASTASASGSMSSESTLSIQTESGARKSYRLVVKDGIASLNGVPIPDSTFIFDRDAIALAFTVLNSPEPRTCSAGLYEHDVIRAGKTRHERGCLESQRSHSLYSAFMRIAHREIQ